MRKTLPAWAISLALAGCADLATEPAREPADIRLASDTATVFAGSTVDFQVVALDEAGREIPIPSWAGPRWTVENATVAAPSGATLTTLAPGQTIATVDVAGIRKDAVVRVNPPAVRLRVSAVYLNQSVQRLDGSVPLVAGRDALLRVFVTGDQPSFFRAGVRATLQRLGALVGTYEMERTDEAIPTGIEQGALTSSWNVLLDGTQIQPGTSLVIEADPDGAVPLAEGSQTRYPAIGAAALDVRLVPKFWLRMVPVFQTAFGTTGRVGSTNLLSWMKPLVGKFPLAERDVDIRAVYSTDARLDTDDGWLQLLREIEALRDADGSMRYYYGVHTNPPNARYGGLGYVGWPAAIGYDQAVDGWETFAHELGHNFGLYHAPCGGPGGVDPEFPYVDGGIGVFGYDLINRVARHPATYKDLMTYCGPEWISDYNYEKVLAYREQWDRTTTGPDRASEKEPALLVWGGRQGGDLVLEPAFELEMRENLPRSEGPYRIEGRDGAGAVLFSYSFAMPQADHAEGTGGFSFAIPARVAQIDRLASLRLTGPRGVAERTRSAVAAVPDRRPRLSMGGTGEVKTMVWEAADHPMALVRDAVTGEVLSFARGGGARVAAGNRPVEILLSDGVRTIRPDVRFR
jgi:hypothetical protein